MTLKAEEALARQIRDDCLEWLRLHRENCTSPPCSEPANFMAYLAHCVGMASVEEFASHFIMYEMECVQHTGSCPHKQGTT